MRWTDEQLDDWRSRSESRSLAGRYLAAKHRQDVRDATCIMVLAVIACAALILAAFVFPWFTV